MKLLLTATQSELKEITSLTTKKYLNGILGEAEASPKPNLSTYDSRI